MWRLPSGWMHPITSSRSLEKAGIRNEYNSKKGVRTFFVLVIVVFRPFLSILLPFKNSLAPCFPSVPKPSVAVYVVNKQSLVGIDQRGSIAICGFRSNTAKSLTIAPAAA